jgi:hypothetical protein
MIFKSLNGFCPSVDTDISCKTPEETFGVIDRFLESKRVLTEELPEVEIAPSLRWYNNITKRKSQETLN